MAALHIAKPIYLTPKTSPETFPPSSELSQNLSFSWFAIIASAFRFSDRSIHWIPPPHRNALPECKRVRKMSLSLDGVVMNDVLLILKIVELYLVSLLESVHVVVRV